jgi:hypothetical protein
VQVGKRGINETNIAEKNPGETLAMTEDSWA